MLVTIGLPFFNAERTLSAAIRSVFAQTLPDWELILIDDGSTDASPRIAQAVAKSDSRVCFVGGSVNRQLSYRLNQIAQLANGYYLARMDADDLMHPERLEQQVAYMEANQTIDILGTGLYGIDARNNPFSVHHYDIGESIIKSLFEHRLIMHPTVLGRTKWFRQNPYDARYVRAEDQELWARTHKWTRFANIHRPLFFYRMLSPENESVQGKRLQDYVDSCHTERRLYRLYGPQVGRIFTAEILCKSFLKEACFRAASKLGLLNTLRRQLARSTFLPIDRKQENIARETIRMIFKVPVPGLTEDALEAAVE